MSEKTKLEVAKEQLRRLGTLTDCVYAVALILVVQWLPLPAESSQSGSIWILDLWAEHSGNLLAMLIAVVFIILYWLRGTDQMARLERTSGAHVTLTIVSVLSLLILLYVIRVGAEVEGASARAGESVAVALIGLATAASWWLARRQGLVREGISEEESVGVQIEAFTEPITALITLPFAYFGELWWNLAWLLYLPVARLLRRRFDRQGPTSSSR
jgi:uncharacterized membrane protein